MEQPATTAEAQSSDLKTESQKVFELLREAILSGRFKPGDKLPQRGLAEEFESTTITVRDALRSLESEGLVEIVPKWGARVEAVTREKMFGRYVVREALEGMAARLAVGNITPTLKDELLAQAKLLDRDLARDDLSPREKAYVHYELHGRVAELADCRELLLLLNKLNLHMLILSNAYHIDWHADEHDWHQYLIRAVVSGDPDLSERTMRLHVQRGYEMEAAAFEQHSQNTNAEP